MTALNATQFFIKFPANLRADYDAKELIPVFQRWIQKDALEGVLIDVANYSHVQDGPGVLLIGHESNWSLDFGDGEPGLLYTRKREALGDIESRLKDAFRLSLEACQLLATDETLKDPISFNAGDFVLGINNRLLAPNDDETFEDVREGLTRFLNWLFLGEKVQLQRDQRSRSRFNVRVRVTGRWDIATLLKRLGRSEGLLN
ncbi:MAG: hypothetical protein HOI23_09375 [Deltaproteobacteria bacterium]|jgi:hypothetical protein|nr:hypothetical protein [Deltaproteobacteria bacterium]MBT6432633.1 hypothetical protein [Deltaproteobacteria bacterium]MBT6490686.1 hypothetical protein [Deltaproteobacteria bacterium]